MNLFEQFTRRAAVLLLCLSMVTGLVLPAFAATGPATETPEPTPAASFKFSNGTITEHIGDETDIVIPAKIDGEEVTKLDDMCIGFSNAVVETIVIPSTVVYYGDYLFDYMYSVTDLYFYGDVPVNFADSLADSIFDAAISDSMLTVHCKDEYVAAFEEAVDDAVAVLGDIKADLVDPAYPEAPTHNWVYTDNGDGTHSVTCSDDGCTETITNETHIFEKGVCVCGGGATLTDDDGSPIAYIYSGATPTFRFGSATPEEPVVLTVLEQYEGETATTVKTYALSELKAMAKNDLVGYQYFNHATKAEGTIASNLYATVSDLLADAGIDFGAGDSITANTAAADFASTLTYEDSEIYKYYINAEGKTEVPPAILISWNSGTGTPEELIKGAYISGNFRFAYGISQEQYDSQNVSGKRLASQVATLTVTHPERVVLNVYEQAEGGETKLVKGYKPSELAALKTEGTVGYQYWKGGEEAILAATEYVTIDNLLTDAGLTFAEGDTLQAAAADGFSGKLTYAESQTNKYFFTNDSKTEVPAALALNWNAGKGALEEVAATAKDTGSIRFAYGVSEQQFADKSAAGKRLVSNVASVTVIHTAVCKHPTTEVVNAKPATCTEDGCTGDLVCTVCGVVIGQGEVIPANCPGAIFSDMPAVGNWAHVGIDYCVKAGLFNGVAADRFAPDGGMTRAMLVTVLWRMSGSPKTESGNPFTDVAPDSWYADAVVWAAENKIVLGVGNGKFDPDASVTREQIATVLFRYAQTNRVDVADRAELKDFPDSAEVSEWAAEALQWAVAAKLVNGSEENGRNYLLPQGAATRAQLAVILMRYEQNFAK